LNGWWCVWKFGTEFVDPLIFVRSANAAPHEPPYQAHETFAVFNKSPICVCVCGGSVVATAGLASAGSPAVGGVLPLG